LWQFLWQFQLCLWQQPFHTIPRSGLLFASPSLSGSSRARCFVFACTIFTVCHGDVVLFGNNKDYTNPKTYYWVIPAEEGKYGGVYFGFDDFIPQGGVNEKGLSYDINALPKAPFNLHPELPKEVKQKKKPW